LASLQEEIDYTSPNQIETMEQVYLGTMGWSYKFWKIYEGIQSSEFLNHYSKAFNSVEVNSTFYRIPRKTSVENWRNQTPPSFRFSVKIPQSISHSSKLNYDPEKLDAFLDHIKPLKEKLGPILIQLPPRLKPENSTQLTSLLNHLEKYTTAVEFRHKNWFRETTYNYLRDHNTALVYVEHPWQPTQEVETSNFTYIRLEGDRKKVSGEKGKTELNRITDNHKWAEKIADQNKRKRATYLYVSKYYSGYPPIDIQQINNKIKNV
jgi:uncharacterized protein YecE (DUF72 family)